mmetsp:Transcript_1511/g.2495  ORF Transcript_1511/g.2495 Transcript_1511/m.2495 type:complete len:178 (-) Transcript_1511:2802-3335(-)
MLKSQEVGDDYKNVNLSNLKILSTTKNTAKSAHTLEKIDAALRDIEAVVVDENFAEGDHTADKDAYYTNSEEDIIRIGQRMKLTPRTESEKIPIILSIQHENLHDIVGAVETFLHTYQQSHRSEATYSATRFKEDTTHRHCKHCDSTEIRHAEQIAHMSKWRKSLMANLNLKTKTFD